jgi:bis(5'-nucleosyl)-tetraphosphatase (symmetrical)
MNYMIGDLQGCCDALDALVKTIDFSPSRDHLYFLGDLVNRGPRSSDVLRQLSDWGCAVTCVLGNHDLHLLAVAAGTRALHPSDTLQSILQAPERTAWLEWLRHQPLAHFAQGWLMVHAGVVPQWDLASTLRLAQEVEVVLQSADCADFFRAMYGNHPNRWTDDLQGFERLRVITNVLTRIRFCTEDGVLDFDSKEGAEHAPAGFCPWFEIDSRLTHDTPIAFGHWSTLGLLNRPKLLGIDTGCVWGGALTAVRFDAKDSFREVIQVRSPFCHFRAGGNPGI